MKAAPRVVITDHGTEFGGLFRSGCRRQGIRQRFGKVGRHGSIAIVERFIRSMKTECTRRILVPFRLAAMRDELGAYATWYNEHRPHEALGGRTPNEVYSRAPPANEQPRLEPRLGWPRRAQCASPQAPVDGRTGARLELIVRRLDDKAHLPVIVLRRVG